jgi:hypothetical protein
MYDTVQMRAVASTSAFAGHNTTWRAATSKCDTAQSQSGEPLPEAVTRISPVEHRFAEAPY